MQHSSRYTIAFALIPTVLLAMVPAASILADAEREAAPTAVAGSLSDEERTEIVTLLEVTQNDLLDRVAELSDEAFNYKSSPDRWSLAQILEHLVIVEKVALGSADKAVADPVNPKWAEATAGQTDKLYRFVPNRVQKFQAPETVQPKSEMKREELVKAFKEARARSIAMIRDSADKPIKAHTADHQFLGPLGVHQWMLFAGLHNLRHNQQAVEVMAEPGFPH